MPFGLDVQAYLHQFLTADTLVDILKKSRMGSQEVDEEKLQLKIGLCIASIPEHQT